MEINTDRGDIFCQLSQKIEKKKMSKSNQQVICDNLPRSPIPIAYTEMLSV